MTIELDHLEELWPPHRGAVLLGAARESQGRFSNAFLAVTAGHVALSIDVHSEPARTSKACDSEQKLDGDIAPPQGDIAAENDAGTSPEAQVDSCPSVALHLTVLLDAVPDGAAASPGSHQMARFLTKVLSQGSSSQEHNSSWRYSQEQNSTPGDHSAAPLTRDEEEGAAVRNLGEDIPEMLVVEHADEVIASEFIRFDHHQNHGKSFAGNNDESNVENNDATPGGASNTSGHSGTLIYACVEASGLLRFWKWGDQGGSDWSWTFMSSCNICACREEPVGCHVTKAFIVLEPEEISSPPSPPTSNVSTSSSSRHRLVWEQEDHGEGAGLGLAFTPAVNMTHPPRKIWSRRINFDRIDYAGGVDSGAHMRYQRGAEEDGREEHNHGSGAHLEINLGFPTCLLSSGAEALLGSRLGTWVCAGRRVSFNHFATGRLPNLVLPREPTLPSREHRRTVSWGSNNDDTVSDAPGRQAATGGNNLRDPEADADEGDATVEEEKRSPKSGAGDNPEVFTKVAEGGDQDALAVKAVQYQRVFAVHDPTGDLMMYDHPGLIRAMSLLSGGGGLNLRVQCTLSPFPSRPPSSIAVRGNLCVLTGGGACSVYDLCTGCLLGATTLPRCPLCAFLRRHSSAAPPPRLSCACGRRRYRRDRRRQRPAAGGDPRQDGKADPMLWMSETRGHLLGIVTLTQVLRIRLPSPDTCLAAMLAPSRPEETPSAPSILRYVRDYDRLAGVNGGTESASLLPAVLRIVHGIEADGGGNFAGVERMIDLLSAEQERSAADKSGSRAGKPPWLLMAMMSAARDGPTMPVARHQDQYPKATHRTARNPVTAAAEAGLRSALEMRVAESLRSIDTVRLLLQDPAGSVIRPEVEGGVSGGPHVARIGTDKKLASLMAEVDPATALFDGILREWLACRRGDDYRGGRDDIGDLGASGDPGLSRREVGVKHSAESSGGAPATRLASTDALALAFDCEAAGDINAQEIPFLQLLLGKSPSSLRHSGGLDSGGGGDYKRHDSQAGEEPHLSASSSSTFLCLHLAGDDASPLFEVACRALFRSQPQQLPRFVERLARFRAYANEMRAERVGNDDRRGGEDEEEGARLDVESDSLHTTTETTVDIGSNRSSSGGTGGTGNSAHSKTISSEGAKSTLHAHEENSSPPPSTDKRHVDFFSPAFRSTSSTQLTDPNENRAGERSTTPSSSIASRSYLSDAAIAPSPRFATTEEDPNAAFPGGNDSYSADQPPRAPSPASVAANYFSRAVACLPPAGEDCTDSANRRARLSLLMGARMFTEAFRLLRARAWGDSADRGWRQDRGAMEAWKAAMRLLSELKRAAVEERVRERQYGDEEEEANTALATAAAAAAGMTGSVPGQREAEFADAAAGFVGDAPPPAVYGSISLQYRLAFEDALAETVLADSPDRMEMVMRCRPEGLTPVAVVRMVRRLAEMTAASSANVDGSGHDQQAQGGASRVPPIGQAEKRAFSGSTQTLKRCLMLLVDDEKEGAIPV